MPQKVSHQEQKQGGEQHKDKGKIKKSKKLQWLEIRNPINHCNSERSRESGKNGIKGTKKEVTIPMEQRVATVTMTQSNGED